MTKAVFNSPYMQLCKYTINCDTLSLKNIRYFCKWKYTFFHHAVKKREEKKRKEGECPASINLIIFGFEKPQKKSLTPPPPPFSL